MPLPKAGLMPGDMPDFSNMGRFGLPPRDPVALSGSDKMMLFGAMLKDAVRSYNGEDGKDLANTQSLLAQRQALVRKQLFQQKLGSLLAGQDPQYSPGTIDLTPAQAQGPNAPQFDAGPTRTVGGGLVETAPAQSPLTMNDPRMAGIVLAAQDAGVNMDDLLKVFTAQQPNVQYDRGYGYNAKTGNPMGGYHPDLDKGMMPGADGVVRNARGYVASAAEAAGAVAGAQEGGKAAWDVIQVPMPDGSTRSVPRSVAAAILAGGGGGPAGFGQSQTPADKVGAEGTAKTAVERNAAQPQQFAGLMDQGRATDLALSTIDRVIPMISGMTAGFASNLGGIKGTPAYNLKAALDPLRAMIGFGELQKMRQNSPTGGALGQVSEQENRLLQSLYGNLDPGQDPKQLAANLQQARKQLLAIKAQREQLYNQTYSANQAPRRVGGLSAIPVADRMAEARRRGLIP